MKTHFFTHAITLFIGIQFIMGCSAENFSPFETQREYSAPTSEAQTGWLVQGASEQELASVLKNNPQATFRTIHQHRGIYEVFNINQDQLNSFSPQVQVEKNEFYKLENRKHEQIIIRALNKLMDESVSQNTNQGLNRCIEASQRPQAHMKVHGPRPANHQHMTLNLGEQIQMDGSSSQAHSDHPSELRHGWVLIPPEGSLQEEQVFISSEIEVIPDSMGLFGVVLVVQDQRDVCGILNFSVVVTDNKNFVGPDGVQPPVFNEQSLNDFPHLAEMGAEESWKISQGEDVLVAVIDSGVNYNSRFLAPNIHTFENEIPDNAIDDDGNGFIDDYVGYDFTYDDPYPFDDNGHGSHVSGLIASPYFGMAPKAKILPIKAFSALGGDTGSIIGAIYYAIENKAQIINMSFGNYGSPHPLMVEALDIAESKGILVIAAAGNGHPVFGVGLNTDITPNFPSALPNENIIAVAAKDASNALTSYSNYGRHSVHICAPGGSSKDEMLSVFSENPAQIELVGMYGTSMATPVVSGIAAQIWSANPSLTFQDIKTILMTTGPQVDILKTRIASGRHVNGYEAVQMAWEKLNIGPKASSLR